MPYIINTSYLETLTSLQASGGDYISVINAKQGVLVASWTYSPAYTLEMDQEEDPDDISGLVPALQHWSDVASLQYQQECRAKEVGPKGLKHVFVPTIQQDSHITENLVKEVWTRINGREDVPPWRTIPSWPRRKNFTPDDEQGCALLASPSLKGLVFMLLRHRAAFGHLTVKRIALFKDDTYRKQAASGQIMTTGGPSLYVEVESVPVSQS